MVKFFMYTDGRTGSTAMCDVLNVNGSVCSAQELFTYGDAQKLVSACPLTVSDGKVSDVIPCFLTGLTPSDYLAEIERVLSDSGFQGFGFKLLYNHATHWGGRDFLELLRNNGFRATHNIRKNVKRKALSGYMARARGVWNSDKDISYNEKVVVDTYQLDRSIEMFQKRYALQRDILVDVFGPILETHYESFLEDEPAYVNSVFDYLGIPVKINQSKSSWKKILPDDLSEVVENFEELRDWITADDVGEGK